MKKKKQGNEGRQTVYGGFAAAALLALQADPSRPQTIKQLLNQTEFKGALDEEAAFAVLEGLASAGVLQSPARGKYGVAQAALSLVAQAVQSDGDIGVFEVGPDGEPYVSLPDGQTIRLADSGPIRSLPGDKIRVQLSGKGKKASTAKYVETVERKRTDYVGVLAFNGYALRVFPQENKVKIEFAVQHPGEAQPGDKVVVRLTEWTKQIPSGEIIRVLGPAGSHQAEMHAIIAEYGLPTTFPSAVEAEANALPAQIPDKELKNRKDFRNVLTLTIDPVDAKDFDDAISFRVLANGRYEVGVHIADVTHYVRPGTLLDDEAFERATSVYLVDRTIPMLPERLSNDLCSLRPHEDRLAFAAVFELNENGKVLDEWFGRTIIHSARRFSYEEVQEVLDTGQGDHAEVLHKLNELAHALRKERFAKGSVNFETEEVKFRLDADGRPLEVFRKIRKDSHKLVEDFMLLANRRVAEYVAKKRKDPPIPFVYRIHGVPEEEKLRKLKTFLGYFGYDLDIADERAAAKSLNALVNEVEGKPEMNIIQSVAIRSMPKAIYTTDNVGHYGLGFKYYTHFTSPIRRYPDVLAHRILQHVLIKDKQEMPVEELEKMCKHSSDRERRAAEAERASVKYKQIEWLGAVVGEEYDGLISGVTDWGMYVELEETKCEGMVPLREIHDDHYSLDETGFVLVGRKTGRRFRLGDKVRVRVKRVNLFKRQADFELLGGGSRRRSKR